MLNESMRCVPQSAYLPIHGYTSLVICILGSVFNVVNLAVLSHKEMRLAFTCIILILLLFKELRYIFF